jgi:hypothetical protein
MKKEQKSVPPLPVKWEDSEDCKRLKEEMEAIKNRDWSKPPHLDPAVNKAMVK